MHAVSRCHRRVEILGHGGASRSWMQPLADRALELVPLPVRHCVLAASLIVHLAVIGWLMFPAPLEKLAAPDRYIVARMVPPSELRYCPRRVWVEHRSGCVVTRKPTCRWPSRDREKAGLIPFLHNSAAPNALGRGKLPR